MILVTFDYSQISDFAVHLCAVWQVHVSYDTGVLPATGKYHCRGILRRRSGRRFESLGTQKNSAFVIWLRRAMPASLTCVDNERLKLGDYPSDSLIHRLADTWEANEEELLILVSTRPTACPVNWLWILYRIPALFAQFPELIELPVMYWLGLRPATTLVLT